MNITITFLINARKFYQTQTTSNYYHTFNDAEKQTLKSHIMTSDRFKKSLIDEISSHPFYNGKVILDKLELSETNNKLYLTINSTFDNNIDNYTADRIKTIIKETHTQHFMSGEHNYGNEIFYTVNTCNETYEHDHDFVNCSVKVCTENEALNSDNSNSGSYAFNTIIQNITIENEEFYNQNGTNKINFKLECKDSEHKYYVYLYKNNREILVDYSCLLESDYSNNRKSQYNILMIYYKNTNFDEIIITDKNHNLLHEYKK